jgi:LytR_cpsA_psr family
MPSDTSSGVPCSQRSNQPCCSPDVSQPSGIVSVVGTLAPVLYSPALSGPGSRYSTSAGGAGSAGAGSAGAGSAGAAGAAEPTGSSGFVPAAFEGLLAQGDSSTVPADEIRTPAKEPTKDLSASSGREPTKETREAARKLALERKKEARLQARREAAREARQEAAREAAAREAAAREAEQAPGEPLDVLVLGVDRRPSSDEGESTRSDTMMLVRVIPATGEVRLLSVPRDLYVEVKTGEKNRINTAYAYGGVEQARAVMEDLTGVEIDNYAVVDFNGFEKVIDAIGKVRVDVGSGVFPAS